MKNLADVARDMRQVIAGKVAALGAVRYNDGKKRALAGALSKLLPLLERLDVSMRLMQSNQKKETYSEAIMATSDLYAEISSLSVIAKSLSMHEELVGLSRDILENVVPPLEQLVAQSRQRLGIKVK